ncbi:sucrose phosphorylase [Maribacter sp. MAR_2009_72]|uniref:sucrose phosphorylase n=1 Tax=Maribacter sp. MAR_2009_72 TaxID=1250050 RepID=UPI00119A1656|nr:sucrose phosphorylase [Maribacter sp. MAR_2009_72]TVZ16729.1 sucrose phosphorylase [Maribacter sp. MAR_2009_72]
MNNKVQLITYVDRLGCENINGLNLLLQNQLKGLFGGVHLLPFYYPIDGEDAGFDPIDHKQIDERLGNWNDLKELSGSVDVMADLIVNHMSAKSSEFQDFLKHGEDSDYAELFLTFDKVFPKGATEQDLLAIYRPRPGYPFSKMKMANGEERIIWTTFTTNQIDIDVYSSKGVAYLDGILNEFQKAGVNMIRLDAAGYAIKKAGTSSFMIDETFAFIDELTVKAKNLGIAVLVEIHSFYKTQIEIAKKVDFVYDFALPVLVLDTLFNANAQNLKNWLEISPRNAITVLDTHDGIGIIDVASENGEKGLIDDNTLDDIVERMHTNSGNTSRKATGAAASNLDLYQVNCTYFEALGKDQRAYFAARAIQFFVPGIPQVYYVGLFSGENDMELLTKTNVGRDINRHYFDIQEIETHIKTPFFKKFEKLMRLRNSHVAFNGTFNILPTEPTILNIRWEKDNDWVALYIDLTTLDLKITYTEGQKEVELL